MNDDHDVLRAAAELVAAFGEHRTDDYFACFDQAATFVFHNVDRVLDGRAAYRALWERWECEDGFQVCGCESSGQRVSVIGDVAIFTHAVATTVHTRTGEERLSERETIVFARSRNGRWLAVHEHLSAAPDPDTLD